MVDYKISTVYFYYNSEVTIDFVGGRNFYLWHSVGS